MKLSPKEKSLEKLHLSQERVVLKHCLNNAYQFGSVNPNVVLGLILRDNPKLKKDIPEILKEISKTTNEIENLSKEDLKKQLKKIAPQLLKKEKPEKTQGPLKPLLNAKKGKVKVRIAPSPSGPLHIGHAYGASLNYEYARMYQGKFVLRIEDTNPSNIYEPAYELIKEDSTWLTDNHVSQIIIQSERLGVYYDHAEKLVQKNKAYVCLCNPDEWRKMKANGKSCPCRDLKPKEQQIRYAKMFNEYAEGEAVLKLKTDIQHKNPAMRDFSIVRINEHLHPKTKKEQRVWPLMVFSVAIDDHELGITHVLNGKDHHDNSLKEALIMEYLGWQPPHYQHWGRINFEGFKLSTSKTKIAIEQGEYAGWDDIRLMTLMALRKRGYQAGTFRKYATEIGLSLNDKTVSKEEFWKNINAFNKEIIEPKANRHFFIDQPKKITIEKAPKKDVTINLHPDFPKKGKRTFHVGNRFYLSQNDLKSLKVGKIHRLMDCFNFEFSSGKFKFVSESYEEYKASTKRGVIIHWLPVGEETTVEVVQEDGSVIKGLGEKAMKDLKEGTIVQLERRYFAKLDKKTKNKLVFWYLHK